MVRFSVTRFSRPLEKGNEDPGFVIGGSFSFTSSPMKGSHETLLQMIQGQVRLLKISESCELGCCPKALCLFSCAWYCNRHWSLLFSYKKWSQNTLARRHERWQIFSMRKQTTITFELFFFKGARDELEKRLHFILMHCEWAAAWGEQKGKAVCLALF